jgi:ribonuclease VapC
LKSGFVVDTSAVVATLLPEPRRDAVLVALAESDRNLLSSCCLLEASIVAQSRLGREGQSELERLLQAFDIETRSFTSEQAILAIDAWERFGKGRHAAQLNIVDCCAYALAKHEGLPLLALGKDFERTDLGLVDLTF